MWWVATAECRPDEAEALADWGRDALGVEPVQLERAGAPVCWVEFYLEGQAAALETAARLQTRPETRAAAVRPCRDQDWQSFWKIHFKTRRVGRSFLLVPAWEAEDAPLEADAGRHRLVLNPGLSFGTGDHFTTRFCLEALEDLGPGDGRSLLDVGTGSGVLALAAVRYGYGTVAAFDLDPVCLAQNRESATLNDLENRVDFHTAALADWPRTPRYDVVCANLLTGLLLESAERLVGWAGSALILSGIQDREADAVAEAYLARGATEPMRASAGEWCGVLLRFGMP